VADGEGKGKTTRVGGFELLERLGQGGMGVVYKARQLSMDRIVAVKILPPRLAKDQAFVERFVREAQSAAKLSHPNIVQGIDVGVADGTYYFAMEFVDGPTVKAVLLRAGTLEEKRALGIVQGVARALEHAHGRGIVHRDIKPDNIMVASDGTVKLADLGLARSVEKPTTLTVEGSALGTPYYMAPEQIRGLPDIDTRADIYALGATLFHLVTGQFPYDGPSAAAIMTRHVTDPVPSARTANPNVSRACDELIRRMMAKDPADRPQTPAELIGDIDDALAGRVHLRPSPRSKTPTLTGAAKRRKARPSPGDVGGASLPRVLPRKKVGPWLFAGLGLLVLAVVLILLLTRGGGPPKPPPTDPGQVALQQADARAKQHPDKLDAAIYRYQAVAQQYPGSRWADIAAGRVAELRKRQSAATAWGTTTKEVEAAIAKLKTTARELAAKDRFGDALKAIDAFAAKHRGPAAADAAAALKRDVLAKADARFDTLADAADDAKGAGDYAKARAILKPVLSFGIPGLVEPAKRKLAKYDEEQKNAEHLAKWGALKAQAATLTEESKFDAALKLLDTAKAIPLADIADRIADEVAAVEDARQAKLDAALDAYQQESDKVWALFKEGDYAKADQLLRTLPEVPNLREGLRLPAVAAGLAADQQAARLLKGFWAAVEEGLKLKIGGFLAFGGTGGTIAAVKDGRVTLTTPKGPATLPVHKLGVKQALLYAQLKDDVRSHLTRAVFLLASGAELDEAEKALAAAGDAPGVEQYRDRLAALRAGATEHAARRAWERIERVARSGLRSDAVIERLRLLLGAFEREHAATKYARQVAAEAAALRERVQAVSWSAPFGAVNQPVTQIPASVDHCGQVWQVSPAHPAGTRYRVRIQHAAPGDKGAFRIWAWADADGDGAPDTRIGTSGILRAKKAGDWSVWEFATAHTRVLVGNWFAPKTALYYQSAGSAYTGLSGTPFVARALGAAPTERAAGPRFTSIQVQVKRPPRGEAPKAGAWQSLFDGRSLRGWRVVEGAWFAGHTKVRAEEGQILLERGPKATGVAWTGGAPRVNYELTVDVMRVSLGTHSCGIVFPVGESECLLLIGAWGKNLVALDGIDGQAARETGTVTPVSFGDRQWYSVRLRVTDQAIRVWVDTKMVIGIQTEGRRFAVSGAWVALRPMGMASWRATTALRNIRLRRLGAEAEPRGEAPKAGKWQSLFDGKSLRGWRAVNAGAYAKHGKVRVDEGVLALDPGGPLTGVACTQTVPSADHEVALEAKAVGGEGDFCVITFPIGASHCALALGIADGPGRVGLHKVDGRSAGSNATTARYTFAKGQWHRVRLRVSRQKIEAWVNDDRIISFPMATHTLDAGPAYGLARPLALSAHSTASAFRNIRLRRLGPEDEPRGEGPRTTRSQPIAISVKEPWPFSMKVRKGQRLDITATGRWRIMPRGKWHGPGDKSFYLRGRLGDGQPFKIGADHTLEVQEDAILHLGMNEGGTYANNSGSITVVIETTQ